jgi:hypothetical protein
MKKDEKKEEDTKNEGFQIRINKFGQVELNEEIDKLNSFLNENVEDKKLVGRKDLYPKKKKEE